jgi:mannose-6-phosphate isomerase
MKLDRIQVEKPWGRMHLPAPFQSPAADGEPVGEIWFAHPDGRDLPLLVKYIFTSERLSIQVHPNDEEARARGLPRGKSECWYVLDADPGATLGLGLKAPVDAETLRAAALDGSIEEMMDWKPVKAGDFFFVPAGTVHAIGGISLVEVQQNSDVTYRLYDYGRPRELHLGDGVEVSKAGPYAASLAAHAAGDEARALVTGPHFSLLHLSAPTAELDALATRERWAIPLTGNIEAAGVTVEAGECAYLAPGEPLRFEPGTRLLVAAPGAL